MSRAYLERIREALEVDDHELALDLVDDLLRQVPPKAGKRRCPEDGCSFRGWPGQVEAHQLEAHSWRWEP